MNHIYRLVFNRRLGLTQVAPETAHSHGKGTKARAIVGAVAALGLAAGPGSLLAEIINGTNETVIGPAPGTGTKPSPWNIDSLDVFNNGSLSISAGGSVTTTGLVSVGGGAPGQMLVTGAGSSLASGERIFIGGSSTGSLRIDSGGQVTSASFMHIGNNAAGTGDVMVTGTGSSLTASGTNVMVVGVAGTGSLTIQDGAAVNAGYVSLARDSGSTGTLNIGAAEGSAAVAPGSLQINTDTSGVQFGDGTATLVFNHTATDYSFDSKLRSSGSGTRAIKVLAGTTKLTGDNASFIGRIFLSGGTLSVASNVNLGNPNPGWIELAFNGGTLATTGNFTASPIVTLTGIGGTLDVATGTSLNLTSAISGAGQLVKTGAGTLILIGDNTYTGGTTISNGTLQIGNGGTAGSISGNVTNNAALAFNRSDDVSFTGVISGSGTLEKQGAGTLTLTGTNTYSGGTSINAGTLSVSADNNLGTGTLTINGGTLATTADLNTNRAVALTSTGTFEVASGTTLGLNGAISGAGQLVKNGDGTLTLSGSNSYSGGTVVNAGTLTASSSSAFVQNSAYSINGGTLNLNSHDLSTSSLSGTGGEVALGSANLIVNQASNTSYDGIISGTGQLTKSGSGILTLSGSNSYSGGTTINSGTLQIGNGGTSGSITGNVTNSGTLAFNRSDALTFTGAINGSGNLVKSGAGTLTLSGANTYSGGTQISAGTLIGDTSSIQGDIANAGTLEFAQATDGSFAGNIAGLGGTNGAVVKSDTGTLTLDGTSSLDWTLQGGALVTAAERFTGNAILQLGTNLTFNQNSDASYGGQISGTGNFTKSGSGTLTLTGTNSHNGTLINTGTLSVSSDANLGNPVSTLLLDGGTLATTASFDTNRNVVLLSTGRLDVASGTTLGLQGNVLGIGPLVKTGAGTLNLTGDNSAFTGATSIEAGVLKVNGSLGGSVLVENSGTLGGNGTLGSATVQSGGTVAPGNSIGTLNVGNITFDPGSIYQVEINAAGQSDKILATGTASINGGSVDVRAEDGNYASQTSYTILSAAGRRTGVFDGVTSNLAFLTPSLSYDPNNVYLTMSRNDISFRAIGQTPNQIATGGGVESLGLGNPVYDLALGLSAPQARDAFDQLSGELHASVQGAIIQDSRWVRDAANARLRALSDTVGHDNNFWVRAIGNWGKNDGTSNAASLDRDSRGLLAGFDAQLGERGQGGFLLGKTRSDMNAGRGRGSADVDNLHLGLYGALALNESLSLRGGAFYGQHQIDSKRSVQVRTLNNRLTDERDAQSLQTFAELAYRASLGKATLEPFANLANVQLHSDSSSESGGVAALHSASRDSSTSFLSLGVRPSLELDMGKTKARVYGSLGWQHAFGDTKPKVTQRFIGAGNQFSVAGTPIAKDAVAIEAGMRMELGKNSALNLSYSGQFANQAQDQSANATLEWRF